MEDYKIKTKIALPILITDILILVIIFSLIITRNVQRKNFTKENMQIYEKNKEAVFKVEKIILCSSANAVDSSEEKKFQNLNIYQYTDIAIYIDNGEELSNKNTVKKLYIDNIMIDGIEGIGTKSLNYKNTMQAGLKPNITAQNENEEINFNIVYTNQENEKANYNEPTFYTDCSNPITLEYLNYNIKQDYKMEQNNTVSFDGSILEKAGISVEDIECKIKFKINIENNNGEKYNCWISFKVPLDDIYTGTTLKLKNTTGTNYILFRE